MSELTRQRVLYLIEQDGRLPLLRHPAPPRWPRDWMVWATALLVTMLEFGQSLTGFANYLVLHAAP